MTLVGNHMDWIALPERALTVQAGMLGSGPADCVAGKGLGGGGFNDGALLESGIGIGCGVHLYARRSHDETPTRPGRTNTRV
jgi:hypothetical protein